MSINSQHPRPLPKLEGHFLIWPKPVDATKQCMVWPWGLFVLNTKTRYKRRLPREAVRSFANQLRRVRIRFNMAADANTREASLLVRSVSFFVLLLHITRQLQNIDENHCL